MAAEPDKVIDAIVELATSKKPGDLNKARNKLDLALLIIDKSESTEKEKEKIKLVKDVDKKLKKKGRSVSQVLKGDNVAEHDLVYDAFGETMEPIYYWILDFMKDAIGYDVEKLSDFFAATEASGYYGEMGARRTAMESRLAGGGQAAGLFGTINLVIRSIINLVYDLKTFDMRLKHYDDLKSKDKLIIRSAFEGLKGFWLNEVDKGKGNASIDALAQNLNFITLRDAFMLVPTQDWFKHDADSEKIAEIKEKSVKYVEDMDLTDVVKRILKPRVKEFVDWVYLSEKELRMRRNVEKAYLRAQISALNAYTAWARPYLIAAYKLLPFEYKDMLAEHKEMGLGPESAPTAFHVSWFYLELFGKKDAKIELAKAPIGVYDKLKLKDESNRPVSVVDVKFAFRGAPVPITGAKGERGTGFTGRTFIRFSSYVMQQKHAKLLQEAQKGEVLDYVDRMTTETLDAIADDLKKYLDEKEEKPKAKAADAFPLRDILFPKFVKEAFGSVGKFNVHAKDVLKKMPKIGLSSDEAWKVARLRLVAEEKAKGDVKKVFDNFRKAYKMITPP